jgi:hypothetical protein
MGVFKVEAPAFQAAEQGLDFPAPGIGFNRLGLWRIRAGDDQPIAIIQT